MSDPSPINSPASSPASSLDTGPIIRPAWVYGAARRLLSGGDQDTMIEALAAAARAGLAEAQAVNYLHRTICEGRPYLVRWSPLALFAEQAHFAITQQGATLKDVLSAWLPRRYGVLLAAAGGRGISQELYKALADAEASRRELNLSMQESALQGLVAAAVVIGLPYLAQIYVIGEFEEARTAAARAAGQAPEITGEITGLGAAFLEYCAFVSAHIMAILFITTAVVATVYASRPYLTGPVRRVLDKIFPFDLYRLMTGAQLLNGLAILTRAESRQQDALQVLRDSAEPYLGHQLDYMLLADLPPIERLAAVPGYWPDRRTRIRAALLKTDADPAANLTLLAEGLSANAKALAKFYNGLFNNLTLAVVAVITIATLLASNDLTNSITGAVP